MRPATFETISTRTYLQFLLRTSTLLNKISDRPKERSFRSAFQPKFMNTHMAEMFRHFDLFRPKENFRPKEVLLAKNNLFWPKRHISFDIGRNMAEIWPKYGRKKDFWPKGRISVSFGFRPKFAHFQFLFRLLAESLSVDH